MTINAWTILGALMSLLAAGYACADAFPDGHAKHLIQVVGGACAFVLALKAQWPSGSPNTIKEPSRL